MQIINREPNIRVGICHKITSKGHICNVNKDVISKLEHPFEELRKEGKSIANIDDLFRVSEIIRQRHIAKIRTLKKEKSSGYVLVGGVTCIGTFLVGTIIFMTIKFILMK